MPGKCQLPVGAIGPPMWTSQELQNGLPNVLIIINSLALMGAASIKLNLMLNKKSHCENLKRATSKPQSTIQQYVNTSRLKHSSSQFTETS